MERSSNDNRNLLNGRLGKIMRSKYFPGVIQWPALLIFAFIIYQSLWGPSSAHDNFGSAMTWILWWPLVPIIFLLFGRFWCAICPFATISDLFQKYFGAQLPVPRFLRKYGIWMIDIMFILITWSDHVLGIVDSPRGTGYLLMLIFTGAVVAGIFFERRVWCRYLCSLGGMSGNYARSGMIQLRATPEICKTCTSQACYKGGIKAPGCPMFEFPRAMDTSAMCNYCGHCIKNCPNESLVLKIGAPTKELWFIRRPKLEESMLAAIIMGLVFVQNISMMPFWQSILDYIQGLTGTGIFAVNFTVAFVITMSIPALLLLAAGWVSNLFFKEGLLKNVARFGYALIPLDLAGHFAHNLFHLLAEGLAVYKTFMAMFGVEIHGSMAVFEAGTIQIMQYALIVIGTLGSIYTAYRIAVSNKLRESENTQSGVRKGSVIVGVISHAVLMVILGLANIVLFYLPMAMRM